MHRVLVEETQEFRLLHFLSKNICTIHRVNTPLYQQRKQQLIVLPGEKQGVYFWKTGQKYSFI